MTINICLYLLFIKTKTKLAPDVGLGTGSIVAISDELIQVNRHWRFYLVLGWKIFKLRPIEILPELTGSLFPTVATRVIVIVIGALAGFVDF